jgi:ABC-2 type transport system permease protein
MIVYFVLAMLGGLWMPRTFLPSWVGDVSTWLPTHAYAALGQAVEVGDAPHARDVAILGGYLLLFSAAAAWLYRRDTAKV